MKYNHINLSGLNSSLRPDSYRLEFRALPQPKPIKLDKVDMLKLWAAGLGIPLSVFEDERVKRDIEANDPHGFIESLRRVVRYEFTEAHRNLDNPLYQLECVVLFK